MTSKTNEILKILARAEGFVTARDLALVLQVSTKTVYRSVNEINHALSQPIINSERGKGYQLIYDRYLKDYDKTASSMGEIKSSPLERRNDVLTTLLFKAPFSKNIDDLYRAYYVGDELVRQDLKTLVKILNKYNLVLKKDGQSISIRGDEQNIRRLINVTLMQSSAMDQEGIQDLTSEYANVNQYDRRFVKTQIQWIQKHLNTTVPYPYNVNIFSHLCVLIKRFRQGKVMELANLDELSGQYQQLIMANPKIFKVSQDVVRNTADYLHRDIPEIESYYLLEYLISMRYNSDLVFEDQTAHTALQLADYYLEEFQLDRDSVRVTSLKNDLVSHFRPMLHRISNHIVVTNSLLNDIQTEYTDLYAKVLKTSQNACHLFDFSWVINEDEVGFITLYFARFFEEEHVKKRVLIMCASGIGTSKLLETKVRNHFPGLEIVAVISKSEYETHPMRYRNIDLIISTVGIKADKYTKVVLSTAMFNQQDQRQIERVLKNDDEV